MAETSPTSTSGASTPSVLPQGSAGLSATHVGRFYRLALAESVPEASPAYHQAFYAPREPSHERKGGCRAIQAEAAASGQPCVLYRPVMHQLFSAVEAGQHKRLLLTGGAGCGKSIALLGLVEWARAKGWLVLYVPSATALVQGGYFLQRPGTGTWDTLTCAQQLLKGMLDAHGPQLKDVPAGPGTNAHDLLIKGLERDDDAQGAVQTCVELLSRLAERSTMQPVLIAIDDYNSLHGRTDYGVAVGSPVRGGRRELRPHQLNLARRLRLLSHASDSMGAAQLVASTSNSLSMAAPAAGALPCRQTVELPIPGYSAAEVASTLRYYAELGLCTAPTEQQAIQLMALTAGNAKQLREAICMLGSLGRIPVL